MLHLGNILTINENVENAKDEIDDKKVFRLIQRESIKMRSTFFDDSVEFCHRGFEADETKSDQNNPGGDPQKGQSVDDFGPIDRCRPVGGKEVHLGMRRASSGLRLRKSFLSSPQRCEEGEKRERM